jgi:hypothetical protein
MVEELGKPLVKSWYLQGYFQLPLLPLLMVMPEEQLIQLQMLERVLINREPILRILQEQEALIRQVRIRQEPIRLTHQVVMTLRSLEVILLIHQEITCGRPLI